MACHVRKVGLLLLALVCLPTDSHGMSMSQNGGWRMQPDSGLPETSLPSMARLMRNVDRAVQKEVDRDTGGHDVRIPGGLSTPLSMATDPNLFKSPLSPQDTMFFSNSVTALPHRRAAEDQKQTTPKETFDGDRFSSVDTHYRSAASETTVVEQGVQAALKQYLDETKEISETSKNLWSLCDQQLRNVLKKSSAEQRESLTWVSAQKAKALATLGAQGSKIGESSKQIEEVQRVFDDATEKRNAYRLEAQKLTTSSPQTHEAKVKRQHSLVLLDFYLKAANNMIQESASSIAQRKAELESTRQWYSQGRDGLAEWLKKQELLVNMRVTKRKEASEKLKSQCRRLDQVYQQAKARVTHYSSALLKERYDTELRSVKEDLFAKRQKIQAAKAELLKLAQDERGLQETMSKLNHKVRSFNVDESQLSAPPRVWKNTIAASTVKEGSPVDPSLPPLDSEADGHSLTLKHFEFTSPPPAPATRDTDPIL